MALHPVGAADDQDTIIQHREGALHLGGKIHMAGGIQQADLQLFIPQNGHLGKDGNAPGTFQLVGIQQGIPVIHPPQAAQFPKPVEQPLRQGRFARVHMGQNPHGQPPFCPVFPVHIRRSSDF